MPDSFLLMPDSFLLLPFIFVGSVSFVIGAITGYLWRGMINRPKRVTHKLEFSDEVLHAIRHPKRSKGE